MNVIKNSVILFLVSLSFILIGCADKKSAAQIEDLKKELAALKSNSKTADDILILKKEIASLKEENEAAKKRQLADSKTLQLSQEKISELSQLSQVHDNGSRALSQRIDFLINLLPIDRLSYWKNMGEIECSRLIIKDAKSAKTTTLVPASIGLQISSDSYLNIGAMAESIGLYAQSKNGYAAGLMATDVGAEFTAISPDKSYTQMFTTKRDGGFKSATKDEDKQSVALFRMNENKQVFLYIKDPKNDLIAGAGGLEIIKGDQKIFEIASTKRGAGMRFFDDVGDTAKIGLGLKDDNGEPVITVQGATKFDVLYPKIDRSK